MLAGPTSLNLTQIDPTKGRNVTIIRTLLCAALAGALGNASFAADPSLDDVHQLLVQVRDHRHDTADDPEMRGAVPLLTDLKHELRDWIETQLPKLESGDQIASFAGDLNTALAAADLTSTGPQTQDNSAPPLSDLSGSIPRIAIELQDYGTLLAEPENPASAQPHGLIIVKTSIGILCGTDDSAYIYEWAGGKFRRILEDEQTITPGQTYTPQVIDSVYLSKSENETEARNILILGHESWCASNWHNTYHHIWHASVDGSPAKLLLNEGAYSYFESFAPIQGSINGHMALVEYRVGSLDSDVHSYETVRHYALGTAGPHRIAPIALGPRAFTEEWLKAEWDGAMEWSEPANSARLRVWHQKLHADPLHGEFGNTTHCTAHPDIWQVVIVFRESDRKINDNQTYVGPVFFAVQWRPPFKFQMIAVSKKPRSGCTAVDGEADADRTLFPVQEWIGWK